MSSSRDGAFHRTCGVAFRVAFSYVRLHSSRAVLQGFPDAFHLTQTSVTILAVSGLIFLITMHHRQEGRFLTQTQEEMLLIFCFGLFWMSVLLGWHSLRAQGQQGNLGLAAGGRQRGDAGIPVIDVRRPAGIIGQQRPYPCSFGDMYCIEEEYSFF
ncbi:Ubiquitin-conjugating enzyme E2 8 [Mycena sanguinolenta]|uniref:Ubiquitin-conjugating enzyme E2 8 n=1 Tax=Mycena sanguinolenta TaxID=230812 RepID=A0A8H6Y8S6_9AGAR|nr:Ubiquitin-conjugating enzyme E2 8 [Mycena sanguinolenta]